MSARAVKPLPLALAALAAIALVALAVANYATSPHRASCLVVNAGGRQRLYFGNPGAGTASRAVSCEYQLLSAPSGTYARFTSGPLQYDAKLSPFAGADQVAGAIGLPTSGGHTLRCHTSSGHAVPTGLVACSLGFWQLVPESGGVIVRLQRGSTISAYQLLPASLPSRVHRIFW